MRMRRIMRSPFNEFVTVRSEVDRLYDDGRNFVRPERVARALHMPIDIRGDEDSFTIEAELPGFAADEVSVNIVKNTVTIKAEKSDEVTEESNGYLHSERRAGKVSRSFNLPTLLDAAKAEATVADGVLTLHIPKAEAAKPKTITVKNGK